jgi:hypothetical protein
MSLNKPAGIMNTPAVKPESFDIDKFSTGISYVESSGGKNMFSKTSSATGKHQFLYEAIKDHPAMGGASQQEFGTNEGLQDTMFKLAYEEGLNAPSVKRNIKDLTKDYKADLGDKWNFRPDEIGALTHFLGRQGTRNYLASLRDGTAFGVPGVNKTPEAYLKSYNEGLKGYKPKSKPSANPEFKSKIETMLSLFGTSVK